MSSTKRNAAEISRKYSRTHVARPLHWKLFMRVTRCQQASKSYGKRPYIQAHWLLQEVLTGKLTKNYWKHNKNSSPKLLVQTNTLYIHGGYTYNSIFSGRHSYHNTPKNHHLMEDLFYTQFLNPNFLQN